MDVLMDRLEAYQIMLEVFYEFIPNDQKVEALAQAAERIAYEVREGANDESQTIREDN